jgi:sigma-B regulation protein RsbU (phosphoserine phosphatase)
MSLELLELNTFFTLSYARFDVERAICRIVDCGHPPLLRFNRRTNTCEWLRGVNLPVGMHESEIYRELVLPLEPGDVFVAYSDGVTEAASPSGEQFGYVRLANTVLDAVDSGCAESIVTAIEKAVKDFTGDAGPGDDVTCAVTCIGQDYAASDGLASFSLSLDGTDREIDETEAKLATVLHELSQRTGVHVAVDSITAGLRAALTNIIRHAYRGLQSGSVDISLRARENCVMLAVTHNGRPFDPASQVRGGRVVQGKGSGLHVMEESFDSVTYTYSHGGTQHLYITSYSVEAV